MCSQFLELCAKKGITQRPEKFRLCRRERLAVIRNFGMPDMPSLIDIRLWYAFVNQLAPFLATAPIMGTFRELLWKPQGKRVYWDSHMHKIFMSNACGMSAGKGRPGLKMIRSDPPSPLSTEAKWA